MKKTWEMKSIIYSGMFLICLCFGILGGGNKVLAAELTEEEIYQEMSCHFMLRDTEFKIETEYNEAARSIDDRLNSEEDDEFYSVLFDMAQAVDDPLTTDDSDYLFGLIGGLYCEYREGSLCFSEVEYFETLNQTAKVNVSIQKLAKKIEKKRKGVYGRVKLAHDMVIDMVTYDSRKNFSSSAYGGLYKGRTVCNGYALITYKLLNEMGIPCKFVTGYTKDKESLHAWNMVKIKNKWYNLDVTFDDGDDGKHYRDYFLKTDKSIKKDHTKDYFYRTEEFKEAYVMAGKDYSK